MQTAFIRALARLRPCMAATTQGRRNAYEASRYNIHLVRCPVRHMGYGVFCITLQNMYDAWPRPALHLWS